jgi:hypothetical protein
VRRAGDHTGTKELDMGSEAVVGRVRGQHHADTVRAALQAAGVRVSDISVLFATRSAPDRSDGETDGPAFDGRAGATVGAILGLVAGGCAIAITGLGPLVVGPLIATVGSAAIGAAAGALVGMRLPDADAFAETEGAPTDLVLSVYTETPSQVVAVKQILEAHAASGIAAQPRALG